MKRLDIGRIKLISIFVILLAVSFQMRGEGSQDTKTKILEIKLNEDFIFGEGISEDKEIAYGDALADLLLFVNELKGEKYQEKLSVNDLIPNVQTLDYSEGGRFEVIVYIPFKILLELTPRSESKDKRFVIENLANKDTESIIKENNPSLDMDGGELTEDIELKTTMAEPDHDIAKNESNSISKENINSLETTYKSEFEGEMEEFIAIQDNFSEIKAFLSEMKHSGKIKETGVAYPQDELPSNACLIVMDQMGGLLSLLLPTTDNGRLNYKTRIPDSVENYKESKFILWYRK